MATSDGAALALRTAREQAVRDLIQLIRRCKTCGREHENRLIKVTQGFTGPVESWSWADPTDGHTYRRMYSDEVNGLLDMPVSSILQLMGAPDGDD